MVMGHIVLRTANESELRCFAGTSFFGHTIECTKIDLLRAFDNPTYECADINEKVQNEWCVVATLGEETYYFTIYDWKVYGTINPYETMSWNIGHNELPIDIKDFLVRKKFL